MTGLWGETGAALDSVFEQGLLDAVTSVQSQPSLCCLGKSTQVPGLQMQMPQCRAINWLFEKSLMVVFVNRVGRVI